MILRESSTYFFFFFTIENIRNDKWPETTTQRYQELIECYADKYTVFTKPTSNEYKRWQDTFKTYPTSPIDGSSTAYFNLEDTVAFRTIDHALIEYFNDNNNKKIESFPYLESRQLMTLAFATVNISCFLLGNTVVNFDIICVVTITAILLQ